MVTAAVLGFEATEAFLGRTLRRVPDVQVRLERTVTTGADGDPCLWVASTDGDAVESSLADDPSVRAFEAISARSGERLYDVTFAPDARPPHAAAGDAGATVTGVYGEGGEWILRLRVDSRTGLSSAVDRLRDDGYDVHVDRIWDVSESDASVDGVSPCHVRTLRAALDAGYYEVPRETDLKGLAADLGISHQALSERLRRAHRRTASLALTSGPRDRCGSADADAPED